MSSKLYAVVVIGLPINDGPIKVRSLARQTITIVLTAQIVCAVVLAGFTVLREGQTRLRAFDVSLQGRSDSLLGAIQDAEDVDASVRIDPEELKLPKRDVFAVYNQGGTILGSSAGAQFPLIEMGKDGFRTVRENGTRYRILQREALRVIDRVQFGGVGLKRPVTIVYGSPETHLWHDVFEAASYSLLAIFVVATATILFVGLLLRKALHPLSELADAAGQVSAPSLRFEAPVSVLEVSELRPLAVVLTDSVARLRNAFQKEQQFVGDAAHELKTAIAVVRSSIQLLMMKRRSPQEYEAGLERVLEDNMRVESMVAKMLELASASEAYMPEAAPLDLSGVAEKVIGEMRSLAELRRVEVRSTCVVGALVSLSQERARALISNLLLNAIQHSLPGMSVLVAVERHGAREIVLHVVDSGTGIGEQALPHIFDRFYREDQSRSRDTGGTGLGLSICKSIVETAGGRIEAASGTNAGTTMTVVFSAA